MEIFSARLKFIRENKNLTQAQLADHVGITIQEYTDIECGKCEPNLDTLSKFPNLMGESVDFLIGATHLDTTIRKHIDECIRTLTGLLFNQSQIKKSVPEKDLEYNSSRPFAQSDDEKFNVYSETVNRFEKQLVDNNTVLFDYFNAIPYVPNEKLKDIEEEIIRTANLFAHGHGLPY
ncbi:helix-turn-helix domain-containing protein [Paenibacillus sp. QZ-Y1]|uniref:helix-turn-helix domain-containing protein n=1 Tax=Paenibacillus sp. QZ-Y1 TaxID=3414511 RepID=UPI003F7B112B